jgi:hypothetical protein
MNMKIQTKDSNCIKRRVLESFVENHATGMRFDVLTYLSNVMKFRRVTKKVKNCKYSIRKVGT